jgi:hypothetical protein
LNLRVTSRYQLGGDYPHEGFVQTAIENHFASARRVPGGTADLICIDGDGSRWLIEAKGRTTDIGLDFRTGLGQLLQAWRDDECRYALAMPDIPQFAKQRKRVSDSARKRLNLYWLIVSDDGSVAVVEPTE